MLIFGLLYRRRADIHVLGRNLQIESERTGVVTIASELLEANQQRQQRSRSASSLRQRPSIVGKSNSLMYLVHVFGNFTPLRYYMGVYLLLTRLAQTSLMTIVHNQLAQAAIMGCITLCAAIIQRELSPYRRASDNLSSLLGHGLVFAWVFVMQLRLAGLFQRDAVATVIGVLLCAATLGVVAATVILANNDHCAEVLAEHEGVSASGGVQHEAIADTSTPDETASTRQAEEGERHRQGSALEVESVHSVVVGRPSPDARSGSVLVEEPTPPPELGESGPSAWLARVVGGSLCLEDPRQEQAR